jgi:cell shape-determining protein MreC
MHHDLERARFIDHLTKLQQELERLRMDPGRRELRQIETLKAHNAELKSRLVRIGSLRAQIERLESDNAVLRARLDGRVTSAGPRRERPRAG